MTDHPFSTISVSGFTYAIYLPNAGHDHIQKMIAETGVPYELQLLQDIISRTVPGDTVVDVGANVGNHTLYLAAHGRNVIAIEPNPQLSQAIRQSVARNKMEDRVEVICAACGREAGRGRLNIKDASNLGMTKVELGTGDVEVTTLDTLIKDQSVAVLKIDTEGMEAEVLSGARDVLARCTPAIYSEADQAAELVSILNCLADYGYAQVKVFNATPTHLLLPTSAGEAVYVHEKQVATYLDMYRAGHKSPHEKEDRDRLIEDLDRLYRDGRALNSDFMRTQDDLLEARLRPGRGLRRLFVYRMLRWLIDGPIPLSPKRTASLKRSATKRDPYRGYPTTVRGRSLPMEVIASPAKLDAHYTGSPISNARPTAFDPFVTIIIPVYNGAQWLRNAVHSALSQEGVRPDILIVDDGSSDDTAEIAIDISRMYPQVRVVSLLRNFGCYYARNIGVNLARGDYVATLDADDIIAPDRLRRQISDISAATGAIASRCYTRRWTPDFSVPLTEPYFGENGLVWRRKAVDTIGWYDSVRFGGDTEFRVRLQAAFGEAAVVKTHHESYHLRTLDGSLALDDHTGAYTRADTGALTPKLSVERQRYAKAAADWLATSEEVPYLSFPATVRPFPLGSPYQNASPSLGQRRIGTMASFPARRDNLRRTLEQIVPQLDELRLYLNDYEDIPDFCNHPKVSVTLSSEALGNLRDNGKFYNLSDTADAYVFTLDDDLVYPSDYIRRLTHFIESLDRKAIVGVHGVIFPSNDLARISDRTVLWFKKSAPGTFVDLLGTGTVGWHGSAFAVSLAEFQTIGVCDLWFALSAAKRGIPLFAVPREQDWMTDQTISGTSLFEEASSGSIDYLRLYRDHLRPALLKAGTRFTAEMSLANTYSSPTLESAGIALRTEEARGAAFDPKAPWGADAGRCAWLHSPVID